MLLSKSVLPNVAYRAGAFARSLAALAGSIRLPWAPWLARSGCPERPGSPWLPRPGCPKRPEAPCLARSGCPSILPRPGWGTLAGSIRLSQASCLALAGSTWLPEAPWVALPGSIWLPWAPWPPRPGNAPTNEASDEPTKVPTNEQTNEPAATTQQRPIALAPFTDLAARWACSIVLILLRSSRVAFRDCFDLGYSIVLLECKYKNDEPTTAPTLSPSKQLGSQSLDRFACIDTAMPRN